MDGGVACVARRADEGMAAAALLLCSTRELRAGEREGASETERVGDLMVVSLPFWLGSVGLR